MASAQRPTRRRSARHAFDEDEIPAPKRTKTEDANGINGTAKGGQKATAASKKKAKQAYEENDDDFQFSRRTRSKKDQASSTTATESRTTESKAAPPSRRKKVAAPIAEPVNNEPEPKRRRSVRLSKDREHVTPAPEKPKKSRKPAEPKPLPNDDNDGMNLVGQPESRPEKKPEPTKIILPFADTPIIRRNKEMRRGGNGQRRSSTGVRGRRASSLIESGTSNAVPHSEVEPADFYKHIEQSLPEPRRMKQLLTWCGTRALPEKPSGGGKDTAAIMAARAIQQELLDDFASKSELSDWFSREDVCTVTRIKKPNPRNEQNAAKLEELELEIKRLQEQKKAWQALNSSLPSKKSSLSNSTIPPDTAPSIDPTLLDPEQAAILSSLQYTTSSDAESTGVSHADVQTRLRNVATSLEPTVDLFADGVHKISQYRLVAERVADRILGTAAEKLEDRDKEVKEKSGTAGVGVNEVLGALGAILSGEGVR